MAGQTCKEFADVAMAGPTEPTELQMSILRAISDGRGILELAKTMKVEPVVLGVEIAKLQVGGYIADDGSLTLKGSQVLT